MPRGSMYLYMVFTWVPKLGYGSRSKGGVFTLQLHGVLGC